MGLAFWANGFATKCCLTRIEGDVCWNRVVGVTRPGYAKNNETFLYLHQSNRIETRRVTEPRAAYNFT